MSPLKIIGPASNDVCISSPVLSRNPVFIKTILSFTFLIHSFKLTVVLLSSSIIPTFIENFLIPKASSTFSNKVFVNSTSSGPCIFGFTIYTDLVLEFFLFLKSCKAHKVDTNASIIPSGISDLSLKIIDGFVIR